MYIKPQPGGVNPPSDEDRMPIWRAINGEALLLESTISLVSGNPVTPGNSNLTFILADDRFTGPIWTGKWQEGIEEVDAQNHPGLIMIKIPDDVGDTLRRGSFRFSLSVTTKFNTEEHIPLRGTLLIEYEPTSPNQDIPYKD